MEQEQEWPQDGSLGHLEVTRNQMNRFHLVALAGNGLTDIWITTETELAGCSVVPGEAQTQNA